eukprot:snap_masked-scaffold_3-processed-gene-16.26-mRNA-1 protein AED:1.00 eAED:1.00 QI:0/0/0/0/1/1/2/0/543
MFYKSKLQKQYEEYGRLKEFPLILMGDGRVGKTSLLRNLAGKRFQKGTQSTLVLEDYQIFEAKGAELIPLTKYDLSVQRVKNLVATTYSINDEEQKVSKYNLYFEDELIARTVHDKGFLGGLVKPESKEPFKSLRPFYRVYDFGGQEVFSSVHHIFMNKKAIYLIVFNMTKLNKNDLFRLKFWCESILRNAPRAPVLFVGTFLATFLKKNTKTDLLAVEHKFRSLISTLSGSLNVVREKYNSFYLVENSPHQGSNQLALIKNKLLLVQYSSIFSGKLLAVSKKIKSVYVLFLDNCREESSYMTVQEFKLKAKKCNFSEKEIEEMLEIYSKEGIISYFPGLNLSETENFIFFAPSFLAQALGGFIRDESFHQLAFRTNKKVFSNYRKYIDTGIIRKDLFDVLLQQYTRKEREYVLHLALYSLILFVDPREKKAFIVPVLLPTVIYPKLKYLIGKKREVKFSQPVTATIFLEIVLPFFELPHITDSFLFNAFVRIIFDPTSILDIYLSTRKKLMFVSMGYKINSLLWMRIQAIVEKMSVLEQENF